MPVGLYGRKELLDSIDIAVLAVASDWTVVYVNPACARLLGKTVEDLVDNHWLNVCPEVVGTPYHLAFLQTMETGQAQEIAFEHKGRNWRQRMWPVPEGVLAVIETVGSVWGENEVRPLESDYRAIFDQVNDALFIYDINTASILNVNRRACAMFGYSREELLRLNITDLAAEEEPYTADNLLQWVRKVAQDQREKVMEWKARDKSGRIFWIEVRSKTTSIEGVTHLLAVIRDVTGSKDMQSRLRVWEERYRELFENAIDCIYMLDMDGNFLAANDSMEKLTGYEREELLGFNIMDILAEESKKFVADYLEMGRAITPGKRIKSWPINHELEVITREGTTVIVEVNTWRIYRLGKPVAIQGIARNITRRRREEEARKARFDQLQKLVDYLPDPVLAIDLEGRVTIWNRAMEDYTGVPASQMLGKGDYEYAIPICGVRRPLLVDLVLNPDQVKEAYTIIEKENHVLIGQVKVTEGSRVNHYIWGKASPLWDSEGQLFGAVETIRDITEQKKMEEAMNRTIQELEAILVASDF